MLLFIKISDVLSSLSSLSSSAPSEPNSTTVISDASLQSGYIGVKNLGKKKNQELSIVSVANTNIPPKEPVVYSKQTQTVQVVNAPHDGKTRICNKFK